jgi:hypothetical protein
MTDELDAIQEAKFSDAPNYWAQRIHGPTPKNKRWQGSKEEKRFVASAPM